MPEQEKSPEELLAERKARGDFVEGEEEVQAEAAEAEEVEAKEVEAAAEEVEEVEAVAEEVEEVEAAAEEVDEFEEDDQPGAKSEDAIMVPKGRLDEALQKARQREEELQRRLEAAEERKQQKISSEDVTALENELDELDSKYAELLLEGELEKASNVRRQLRQKQNDLFDIRLEQRSTLASKQAIESMRFDAQLAQFEAKFPIINPDSDNFDSDVAKEVAEMMEVFQVGKGLTAAAALNKAVHYVLRDDNTRAGEDPDMVRTKRKIAARKKVAEVAGKSPPDITDKGRDSDKVGTGDGLPDVTKMTPEQFADLSEAQLRKLRGDTITDQEVA